MVKRLKLRFPRLIASFQSIQICRSRDPYNLPEIPSPAIYRVSTVNQRTLDTVYPPKVLAPPSTPEYSNPSAAALDHHQFTGGRRELKGPPQWREGMSPKLVARITSRTTNRRFRKPKGRRTKGMSVLAFLSETVAGKDMSLEFLCSAEKATEESKKNSEMENVKMARRLRRQALKTKLSTAGSSNASVLRRMVTCTANGKVRESFAVVKRTEEPYEEFKRSMMEIILEKQILEAEELQELLQCFLSLNSRLYHGVIVEAFSDIWEVLFCDSPWGHRASVGF
ncbi:hypothetical protein I3842_15G072700 [Carya illinoinensis]|uniref:Transcription repressor n=1 Tax=Carya illinoinensis TaxID=32201 RepID=A0A922D6V3_CARIL|nr:hypothetical protein I3842_15G072700 [Carya illinoinensis]